MTIESHSHKLSRVVNWDCKVFIRLSTDRKWVWIVEFPISVVKDLVCIQVGKSVTT